MSYGFSLEYERVIAVMCATRPGFYGRVGHALDADSFKDEGCKLLVKVTHLIAKDLGHGPADQRTCLQRIQTLMDDGKVDSDQRDAALDVLIEAVPTMPPEDEVSVEVIAVIRRRMEGDAVRAAMDEYGKRGDFTQVVQIIEKARNLGQVDTSIGDMVGDGSFKTIDELHMLDRLSTGIPELDIEMNSGMPRGFTGIYAADTGGGKTMFLVHQAATAMREGLSVAFATLELSKALQQARLIANLTGESLSQVESGRRGYTVAKQRLTQMYPVLGECVVQEFPAKLTSVPQITDWVGRIESVTGRPVDLLVIDYLDKLRSHIKDDHGSTYATGGTVTETLRLYIHENKKWCWTASQPQRRAAKERTRRIEVSELADSQHKARVADVVITASRHDDQLQYYCAKFRGGKSEWSVGPMPHDWEHARMVVMVDE